MLLTSSKTSNNVEMSAIAAGTICRRSGSGYTQAAVVVILSTIATTAFFYATVIILPTAQRLRSGETTKCKIVAADLACWRRSFLSFSQIEQGHYSCWVFKVEHNYTASGKSLSNFNKSRTNSFAVESNDTASLRPLFNFEESRLNSSEEQFTVQYAPVHAFSKARDTCNSFETCGNTTWTCTIVSKEGAGATPSLLRMRWRYPVKKLTANLTVSVACYAIAALMVWQYLRLRATGGLDEVCKNLPSSNDEACVIDIAPEFADGDVMIVRSLR